MEALMTEGKVSSWNDDGLDELNRRVDEGFAKVDRDMKEGFAELRGEMGYLGERFDRLLHTLVLISWGFAGTLVAALAAVLVAASLV
ncbi:MAG: hypothetical protein ACTHK3_04770 [Solirubrobacterales bacterium]